jgi:hypothetical protein
MRRPIVIVLVAVVALAATTRAPAGESRLQAAAPAKPLAPVTTGEAASLVPAIVRQGGDTIADALEIPTLPFTDSGTTTGYSDDYSEMCPYGLFGPDVVYRLNPAEPMILAVDLCGSSYDTAILVYDQDLELLACNDDYYTGPPCGAYVSYLEVGVPAVEPVFIVVDAYGGDSGAYEIRVDRLLPCELTCPAGAELEGEPPLHDGYVDLHNGGCNTFQVTPIQPITQPLFCGTSGWYVNEYGSQARDTDWFSVLIPDGGVLEITADAERDAWLYRIDPLECDPAEVAQEQRIGRCKPGSMTIVGEPGQEVWLWVGPVAFWPPGDWSGEEFAYVLELNLAPVAVAARTWSAVRELYR